MFKVASREGLEVYVSEKGYVCLKQEASLMGEDDATIHLEPEIARQVASWLMQLADDAETLFSPIEVDGPSPSATARAGN